MGNQLAGIVPAQIRPVEHYFSEIQEYKYDKSFGITRFLKVARARDANGGYYVIKFFIILDNSLPLAIYKDNLDVLEKKLANSRNCCPYLQVKIHERYQFAFLVRPYFAYNLYDRISTRPFLTLIEKKWLAFQLLCALEQCQKHNVCHGDIKSENVLITSWNWLVISDFANFKPTSLPIDNPSDYSYFFDTSRRRTCYLAPERFVSPASAQQQQSLAGWRDLGSDEFSGDVQLTHKMDLFSTGCVIAELFTEGQILFDLEQLLLFKCGKYSPEAALSKIPDPAIQAMVRHMIQADPHLRDSADSYLITFRDKAFPSYFYTCLKPFFDFLLEKPLTCVDDIIEKIHADITRSENNILDEISGDDGVILLLPLVLSCARNLRRLEAKLKYLKICSILSGHLSDAIVLERIVPFLILFVNDTSYLVRCELISILSDCLRAIKTVPPSEAAVFTEYILPEMVTFVGDESPLVRANLARKIGQLAQTAVFFLRSNRDATTDLASYERDELLLHASVQQMVVNLISDTSSIVRRSLLEGSVVDLCTVFGFQKTCDILLSHMVTFLNDKFDWQLRMEFYMAILAISAYIGAQVDKILKPLLIQGLADAEEFVIFRTIWCASRLTLAGLLERFTKHELFDHIRPFLAHPNQWLRAAAVEFCSILAAGSPAADVICYVRPKLEGYLRYPLTQFGDQQMILIALKEEIPRPVYDMILKSPYADTIFDLLGSRRRGASFNGRFPDGATEKAAGSIERLRNMGMKAEHEQFLLNLRDFIKRTRPLRSIVNEQTAQTNKSGPNLPNALVTSTGNFIYGPNLAKQPPVRKAKMEEARRRFIANPFSVTIPAGGANGVTNGASQAASNVWDISSVSRRARGEDDEVGNTEWREMFGNISHVRSTPGLSHQNSAVGLDIVTPLRGSENGSGENGAMQGLTASQTNMSSTISGATVGALSSSTSSSQTSAVVAPDSACLSPLGTNSVSFSSLVRGVLVSGLNLNALPETASQSFIECRVLKANSDPVFSGIRVKPPQSSAIQSLQVKSILVANFHETTGPMYRLTAIGNGYDQPLFATGSDDGFVRLYDCNKMDGSQIVNQCISRYNCGTDSNNTHKMRHLLNYYNHVIAISTTGCAHVVRLGLGSSNVDISDGCQSLFASLRNQDAGVERDHVMASAVCSFNLNLGWVASSLGRVMLIDWRLSPSNWIVWSQLADLRSGLLMAACDIPDSYCFVTGSSNGVLTAWDARFRLDVKNIVHPHNHRVRVLIPDPAPSKNVYAAFQGNNEFSSWDIETGSRLKALWASTNPPLAFQSQTQNSHHYVSAVYPFPDGKQFFTGSSDQRVRLWNLSGAQHCRLVVPAARDPQSIVCRYESRVVDGTEVIAETEQGAGNSAARTLQPDAVSPLWVPPGHRDIITGITVCRGAQSFLVTSSRDGTIKVWK